MIKIILILILLLLLLPIVTTNCITNTTNMPTINNDNNDNPLRLRMYFNDDDISRNKNYINYNSSPVLKVVVNNNTYNVKREGVEWNNPRHILPFF